MDFAYSQEDCKKYLCEHWDKVAALSFYEDMELFFSFIQDCVVEQFQRKFIGEFNLNVRERDFYKYEKYDLDDSFSQIFQQQVQFPISAEITWGACRDQRRSFRLKGRAGKARELFVDYECDAIARIHWHKHVEYLFCSETLGLLRVFSHTRETL